MLVERIGTFYSLLGLEARERCFTRYVIEIIVYHYKNNISRCLPCFQHFFYFFVIMFQNMTRACFLPGFAKLQNTSSSIVIIIFGAKSIGGCVRGRSRVPVTPKPASSDHLQSYSSIVRKFKNIFLGEIEKG